MPTLLGLPQGPRQRPTVGFYGGAVSYERGTPVAGSDWDVVDAQSVRARPHLPPWRHSYERTRPLIVGDRSVFCRAVGVDHSMCTTFTFVRLIDFRAAD